MRAVSKKTTLYLTYYFETWFFVFNTMSNHIPKSLIISAEHYFRGLYNISQQESTVINLTIHLMILFICFPVFNFANNDPIFSICALAQQLTLLFQQDRVQKIVFFFFWFNVITISNFNGYTINTLQKGYRNSFS
jgi:hypothetical protein